MHANIKRVEGVAGTPSADTAETGEATKTETPLLHRRHSGHADGNFTARSCTSTDKMKEMELISQGGWIRKKRSGGDRD